MAGRALREVFADFTVQFDKARMLARGNRSVSTMRDRVARLTPYVDRLKTGLGALGVAIGGAAMIAAMRSFIITTVTMGDELDKTSLQLGISTRELQSYRLAAELSGAGTEQMNTALSQLANKMFQAHQRGGEMATLFRDIGVDFRDSSGDMRQLQDVMADVADTLQATENPTERVGIAMQLFGRSGRQLLPMLQGGSEALNQMRAELDGLGGGMSEVAIQNSVELNDSITRLKVAWTATRSFLATRLLPALDWLVRKGTDVARTISDIVSHSRIFESTVVVLSAALVAAGIAASLAWGPVIITVAVVGIAIAALILIVDDLWTHLEGGESVTGRVIDQLHAMDTAIITWIFGAERARTVIREWNESLEDLKNTLASVAGYLGFTVGEEGSDVRRASEKGRQTAREDPFLQAITSGIMSLTSPSGEAPRLIEQKGEQSLEDIRASDSLLRSTFPELFVPMMDQERARVQAEEEFSMRGTPASGRRAREQERADFVSTRTDELVSARVQGQTVTIDARTTTNNAFNGITDTAEIDRRQDQRRRADADRQARKIQAALARGDS